MHMIGSQKQSLQNNWLHKSRTPSSQFIEASSKTTSLPSLHGCGHLPPENAFLKPTSTCPTPSQTVTKTTPFHKPSPLRTSAASPAATPTALPKRAVRDRCLPVYDHHKAMTYFVSVVVSRAWLPARLAFVTMSWHHFSGSRCPDGNARNFVHAFHLHSSSCRIGSPALG